MVRTMIFVEKFGLYFGDSAIDDDRVRG
jgi:hypothetical protein